MAIQTVDLKVPGGDTPRSANAKINANFSNNDHAASRMIGTEDRNVPEYWSDNGISGLGYGGIRSNNIDYDDMSKPSGLYRSIDTDGTYVPVSQWTSLERKWFGPDNFVDFAWTRNYAIPQRIFMRTVDTDAGDGLGAWTEFYTTANTTKEADTGYIIASSPVLKVQHDSFEKVHEAEQLDIDIKHIKTGVYEITGTTGLRENDGWNLKPPKDINGNVLCICEATQDSDVITLKTYKKKFDFETVSIVADYEQPTDIPEGAEVMLRFNDLPAELMPQEV